MDKSIQKQMILAIDAKIIEAGDIMELADISDEHEDDQEFIDSVYEERFHCGKCIVTNVMETVYPPIGEYFDYLEALVEKHETSIDSAITTLLSEIMPTVDEATKIKIVALSNMLTASLESTPNKTQ